MLGWSRITVQLSHNAYTNQYKNPPPKTHTRYTHTPELRIILHRLRNPFLFIYTYVYVCITIIIYTFHLHTHSPSVIGSIVRCALDLTYPYYNYIIRNVHNHTHRSLCFKIQLLRSLFPARRCPINQVMSFMSPCDWCRGGDRDLCNAVVEAAFICVFVGALRVVLVCFHVVDASLP